MKTIKILGSGCAKCNKLAEAAKTAADGIGLDYEMEKITDMMKFAEFGVMITPAMVVDGEVKVSGRVPSDEDLRKLLQDS